MGLGEGWVRAGMVLAITKRFSENFRLFPKFPFDCYLLFPAGAEFHLSPSLSLTI